MDRARWDETIVVLQAGEGTESPVGGNTTEGDWSNPTTTATLPGRSSPAGRDALEIAGLLGENDMRFITVPTRSGVEINPETTRLSIGGEVLAVRSVRVFRRTTQILARTL